MTPRELPPRDETSSQVIVFPLVFFLLFLLLSSSALSNIYSTHRERRSHQERLLQERLLLGKQLQERWLQERWVFIFLLIIFSVAYPYNSWPRERWLLRSMKAQALVTNTLVSDNRLLAVHVNHHVIIQVSSSYQWTRQLHLHVRPWANLIVSLHMKFLVNMHGDLRLRRSQILLTSKPLLTNIRAWWLVSLHEIIHQVVPHALLQVCQWHQQLHRGSHHLLCHQMCPHAKQCAPHPTLLNLVPNQALHVSLLHFTRLRGRFSTSWYLLPRDNAFYAAATESPKSQSVSMKFGDDGSDDEMVIPLSRNCLPVDLTP